MHIYICIYAFTQDTSSCVHFRHYQPLQIKSKHHISLNRDLRFSLNVHYLNFNIKCFSCSIINSELVSRQKCFSDWCDLPRKWLWPAQ